MGGENYEYDDGIFKYVSPAMVKACHIQMWPKTILHKTEERDCTLQLLYKLYQY